MVITPPAHSKTVKTHSFRLLPRLKEMIGPERLSSLTGTALQGEEGEWREDGGWKWTKQGRGWRKEGGG